MRQLILEKSDSEFYTSNSGLALAGLIINRHSALNNEVTKGTAKTEGIKHADILRSYMGLLCIGKSDYEAIESMREDTYFKEALGIKDVPSAPTLRQRMDELACDYIPIVNSVSTDFIKLTGGTVSPLLMGHVPLDIDVFIQDNSCTEKEGVSYTYKGMDGYAPIGAYLGQEGWCLEIELRPGSQHCQKDFLPYLDRVVDKAKELTDIPILIRLDSGHDAIENRVTILSYANTDYILKWNPRKVDKVYWRDYGIAHGEISEPRNGKKVAIFTVYVEQEYKGETFVFRRTMKVVERSIDKHGQHLLTPDIEIEGWWTSLDDVSDEEIINLYKDHGTSEQFHSEFKTDLDLERLPSGKFATNALVMVLACFSYNILRLIGQAGLLQIDSPVRHKAKRRRLKTVIQEFMYLAGRLLERGRRLRLRFSRHCPAFAAFNRLYHHLSLA